MHGSDEAFRNRYFIFCYLFVWVWENLVYYTNYTCYSQIVIVESLKKHEESRRPTENKIVILIIRLIINSTETMCLHVQEFLSNSFKNVSIKIMLIVLNNLYVFNYSSFFLLNWGLDGRLRLWVKK